MHAVMSQRPIRERVIEISTQYASRMADVPTKEGE